MNINGINLTDYKKYLYFGTNNKVNKKVEHTPKRITYDDGFDNNKQISFAEGSRILWSGVKNQFRDTLTNLFGSPKALLGLMGFTLGLSLLPIVGIPVSVGGGVLAIGFATVSVVRAAKHSIDFVRNNKNAEYNKARNNLGKIGEDTFDLALSVPFVPKSVSSLKVFKKYGKIGIDKSIYEGRTFSEFADEIFNPKYSQELERRMYFNQAADAELSATEGLSQAQKEGLRREIIDYNVSGEMIPEIVLEKWAVSHGIKTKPVWKFGTMSKEVAGCAVPSDCMIIINDYKRPILRPQKYTLQSLVKDTDKYVYTYIEKETGKVHVETVPVQIIDDYNVLSEKYYSLTPQLRQILTTIHEREHIDQRARMFMVKGSNSFNPTPKALKLYEAMGKEIEALGYSAEKSEEIARILAQAKDGSGTFAWYVQLPEKIGARNAEVEALKNPLYEHLDNIYRVVNGKKITKNSGFDVCMNTLRADSIAS